MSHIICVGYVTYYMCWIPLMMISCPLWCPIKWLLERCLLNKAVFMVIDFEFVKIVFVQGLESHLGGTSECSCLDLTRTCFNS